MIKLSKKNSKIIWIAACSLAVAVVILITVLQITHTENSQIISKSDTNVTEEELAEYRENIGNSMDVKKAILIIFNTLDECQTFIDEFGSNENVLSIGKGIIPQMEGENGEQYYNVVGNSVFEPLFDSMKDGEYLKTPVDFGGSYCYFKRLENYSILNNDEDLSNFIESEKSLDKGGEIE